MTTKGSELAAHDDSVGQRTSPDYLALERLTKQFGTVTAVDHVTLTIGEGEFFALLGPSGCGKTTTLRLIAGLERPTEGRILFCGRDITGLHPRERDVAMVFQDYALYPHMTLFDNIGYPLKVRGTPRKTLEARVQEVADHLGIGTCLAAALRRYPEGSNSGPPWPGLWCTSPRSSCSTSPFLTSTRSCGWRPAPF